MFRLARSLAAAHSRLVPLAVSASPLRRTPLLIQIINIVPQQEAWVIERLGKYHRVVDAGLCIVIPIVDRIAYVHSLKEVAMQINSQTAVTQDNVRLEIDGVLYMKVVDPYKASYGVENPIYAVQQLAMTTMRAELGKMTLDRTFQERSMLNHQIVEAINTAAAAWGIVALRYEIRDITPPKHVVSAMEMQVSAERRKRAQILESEGIQMSEINVAEGRKQATVLASEAARLDAINRAEGEAAAILEIARKTAQGLHELAAALQGKGGADAASLRLAEQYIGAFGRLAERSNTMLLPAASGDVAAMVAQAVGIFRHLQGSTPGTPASGPAAAAPAPSGAAAVAAGASDVLSQSGATLAK